MTVYAYLRVSTDSQAEDGYGLAAQRAAIEHEASYRGWDDMVWTEEAKSGATLDRPQLMRLLNLIGRGDTLVVAKLDRLSRSVVDFGTLLERAKTSGWALSALDFGMDTSTPNGELVATVLMAVSQWERRTISQRTKDGLAVARARGVKLGRISAVPEGTRALIQGLSAAGHSQHQIAEQLNAEHVCAPAGGDWSQQQVSRVLRAS